MVLGPHILNSKLVAAKPIGGSKFELKMIAKCGVAKSRAKDNNAFCVYYFLLENFSNGLGTDNKCLRVNIKQWI
jgi:hypothetical protein